MSDLIHIEKLEKTFRQGGENLSILKNLDMQMGGGEMVALIGPSGAGKSTLLQLTGLLDRPTSGRIILAGQDASALNDDQRTKLRREFIGFVYQFHHLQPEFSALENVMLPQLIAGAGKKQAASRAMQILESLGLKERVTHRPARLSGGEQQRVAIARALANNPKLILADEPTGNLDPETSDHVFSMLLKLVKETGVGMLIATHNIELADKMDRVLELRSGAVYPYA